jgi:hypothetical protein
VPFPGWPIARFQCTGSVPLPCLELHQYTRLILGFSDPTGLELFDGKFPRLAMTTDCLVNTSIGSTTDEPNDFITVDNPDLTLIPYRTRSSINGFYGNISKSYTSKQEQQTIWISSPRREHVVVKTSCRLITFLLKLRMTIRASCPSKRSKQHKGSKLAKKDGVIYHQRLAGRSSLNFVCSVMPKKDPRMTVDSRSGSSHVGFSQGQAQGTTAFPLLGRPLIATTATYCTDDIERTLGCWERLVPFMQM